MGKIRISIVLLLCAIMISGCIKRRDNTLVIEITNKDSSKTNIRTNSPAGLVNSGLTLVTGTDSRYEVLVIVGGDKVNEYPLKSGISEDDIEALILALATSTDPVVALATVVKSVFGALVLITDTKGTKDKADDVIYLSVGGQVNLDEVESNYVSGELSVSSLVVPSLLDTVSVIGAFSEIKLAILK